MTFTWYSNDKFHYMFKAEFVTLVRLNVPSDFYVLGCTVRFIETFRQTHKSQERMLFFRERHHVATLSSSTLFS